MTEVNTQQQVTVKALREAQKKAGKLLRLEDLVFESFLDEAGLENTPGTSSVYSTDDERQVRESARQTAAQVKDSILSGLYRMRVSECSSSFNLDAEALESLQLEVALVLLGLQSVPEFEELMQHSPILSAEEGAGFAQDIRKTLFAEVALYLPGMKEESVGARHETLASCIDNDSEVQSRLVKLPESVRVMVQSTQLEEAFTTLQKKHRLGPDVARLLGEQVVRVMVGLTTMNDFKVNVTRVAGIPPSSLDALFMDVEQTLFKPVRTTILGALQKNISSLPDKESSPTEDPYRTPVK